VARQAEQRGNFITHDDQTTWGHCIIANNTNCLGAASAAFRMLLLSDDELTMKVFIQFTNKKPFNGLSYDKQNPVAEGNIQLIVTEESITTAHTKRLKRAGMYDAEAEVSIRRYTGCEKVILLSNDWDLIRNEVTDVITSRSVIACCYFKDKCYYKVNSFDQKFDGRQYQSSVYCDYQTITGKKIMIPCESLEE